MAKDVSRPPSEKHPYVPHKLRSRPFRCISLPVICGFAFLTYWFILCPLIFVSLSNDNKDTWPWWWAYAFWGTALILFIIFLIIAVCIWRCTKRDRSNSTRKHPNQPQSKLEHKAHQKPSNIKELYRVSLIDDSNLKPSKEQLNAVNETLPEVAKPVNTVKSNVDADKKVENPEKEFPKCRSVKRKPELELPRPLSQVSTTSLPRSPLTPRELFFIDLIQAAEGSPASFIPATETFLENEKLCYAPEEVKNKPVKMRERGSKTEREKRNSEYFIANVPDRSSLTTEVFLFVDGGQQNDPQYRVTMCDSDDVFVD